MKENKKLNKFEIFSLGVGGTIGSGIFVMLGIGIGYTGKSISLVLLLGCVYMLFAYLYHIVMSSLFVLDGGDYDAKVMLMNPTLTGVSAIFTYMSGMVISAFSLAFVDYVGMIFPILLQYRSLVAVAIMTLFFYVTIRGTKFVSQVQSVMMIVLLISIGLFVVFGLPQVESGYFTDGEYFLNGTSGFLAALAIMSFACQGTSMAPISVMKVTKDARKVVPIVVLFSALTVGVVYALIGIVATGVLPISDVVGQNLAVVSKQIFPHPIYVIFILGGACFAIGTSILGAIQTLRYPCEEVANDGWLPQVFKSKTDFGYPWVIMLTFYLIAVIPLIFGFSIEAIISLYMIPQMLFNVYLNFSLISVIHKYPKQWNTSVLKMPIPIYNLICAVGGICALLVSLTLFIGLTPLNMVICLLIIFACVSISQSRLKSGAVSAQYLENKRMLIAERAINLNDEN